MQTKKLKVKDIKAYWRNPRINDTAVDAVVQSIKQYGYVQPIIVDKKNTIVAGHTRHRALMQLAIDEVDVIIFEGTAAQAKEYRIIDNKTSEFAEWDMKLLIPELREFESLSHVKVFFPDFNLEEALQISAGVVNFQAPTQEQIEKEASNMLGTFQEASNNATNSKVEVCCPHCGEDFYLAKKDLQ